MDVFSHGNEVYAGTTLRLVLHIHNHVPGSWHIERQKTVLEFIQEVEPRTVIDLGFGVPSRYVLKNLSFWEPEWKVTLCDFSEDAIKFAQELLTQWRGDWEKYIRLSTCDLSKAGSIIGDYDIYMFLDSIEHVLDPTECLKEYVRFSQRGAKFILSIPIGPITSEHYKEWRDIQESKEWLKECGLRVVQERVIWVNPEVDLFAEVHNFEYADHVVLCEKMA